MLTLNIKKNHDRRAFFGHPWIFSNELEEVPKAEAGDIAEVIDSRGRNLGLAFFNPHSLISARLLYSDKNPDTDFFVERIKKALEYRDTLFPHSKTYRLVFGESDFLPGLVADRFGDYLSIQSLSAGIEKRIDMIAEAFKIAIPGIRGIYAKNISNLRQYEGLEQNEGILFGEIPDEIICEEEGIKLSVSLSSGQKTGYFLDQRINRKFIRDLSNGLNVLDCYCNQGGFALNAALGGASQVTAVDISQPALEKAKINAELNGFHNFDFAKADVVDYLKVAIDENRKWDMIVLDPPSFTKSRKKLPQAKAGYAKINRLAMQLLPKYSYLVSSSCTQQVEEDVFLSLIHTEAAKLGRQLRVVFRGMQSPCHPILPAMPETMYLKFYVFQVI
jgi:23S rRNA (cytosine1962-C5)-methyltransferase